jgi:adenylosuccinate lyase
MRAVWGETRKRELWRSIWVSLARVESAYGLTTPGQVAELEANASSVDIARSLQIEEEIRHDLMAEIKAFAEQCPTAGGVIHLGATSMDIEDNADAIRLRDSLLIVKGKLGGLLGSLAGLIERYADLPVMAFTHLQPAEPTTFGYRCAVWAQDLLMAYEDIAAAADEVRGKGFKGAVGTAASYGELFGKDNIHEFERAMEKELGILFYPIATQTCTRIQEYRILTALATLGAALHKMAFDLRVLQSPPIGEVAEPFAKKQVGSSAMPFKRNPIDAEKIDSLSRLLSSYPQVAWSNASLSLLERTLDDSANRRTILPESFLIADEILKTASKILDGLSVDEAAAAKTYEAYAPFACTERLMMALAKVGADRQIVHEKLRAQAMAAWAELKSGKPNPLVKSISADSFFLGYFDKQRLSELMDLGSYLGDAPERARSFAAKVRTETRGT